MSAAQKISRLAIGEPATPTLVVYRTPEDTSQDYHIEGLPFGTRGGMLVKHVFPSDGEYHDDGDADLRRQHVADRLRLGAVREARSPARRRTHRSCSTGRAAGVRRPAANCGGRGQVRRACRAGQARRGSRPQRDMQGSQVHGDGRAAHGGRHVPADELRAGARPRSALHARHAADRSDARLHLLPACRHRSHRRSVQREAGEGLAEPPQDFRLPPTGAADEAACARKIITNLATNAFRRPATPADVNALMEFYKQGRKEGEFRQRHRDGAGAHSRRRRSSSTASKPSRQRRRPASRIASPISTWRRACRSSCGAPSPDDELLRIAGQGRLKDPVVLEQQVRRMLKDPRAEALAVNFAGQWLNLRGLQAQARCR